MEEDRELYDEVISGTEKTVTRFLLLHSNPKNLNWKDHEGRTPLFMACANNKYKIVEILASQEGLDFNLADNNHRTPLFVAAQGGYVETIGVLLNAKNKGKNIDITLKDNRGRTPYDIAEQGTKDEQYGSESYYESLELLEHFYIKCVKIDDKYYEISWNSNRRCFTRNKRSINTFLPLHLLINLTKYNRYKCSSGGSRNRKNTKKYKKKYSNFKSSRV